MGLTKRIFLAGLAMVAFITIAYLSVSFVKLTFNFSHWEEITRAVFIMFSLGLGFCIFGAIMSLTEND